MLLVHESGAATDDDEAFLFVEKMTRCNDEPYLCMRVDRGQSCTLLDSSAEGASLKIKPDQLMQSNS